MKILILGYSVTAENPGFVELASKEPELAGHEWHKLGLGGFMPSAGVHMFCHEIERIRPDLIVLEQSTPAYRLFQPNVTEYPNWIMALLRQANQIAARFVILDLPRIDVDFSDDWMVDIHKEIAGEHAIGHVVVPLIKDLLRDTVHPTEEGRRHYAQHLVEAISAARPVEIADERFEGVDHYSIISLCSALQLEDGYTHYDRGGLDAAMIDLPVGKKVGMKLLPPSNVIGVVSLIGPKTGYLNIRLNDERKTLQSYDPYAYYNRAAHLNFSQYHAASREKCSYIEFEQLPNTPETELIKGDKDFSGRVGGVSHLLVRGKQKTFVEKAVKMPNEHNAYFENTFARGFMLFKDSAEFAKRMRDAEAGLYLGAWTKTFFGPAQLWYDPRLNYATARDAQHGVGLMGLCLNPFDGANDNQIVADRLYEALKQSETAFLDYVDQLSGAFVIIYRIGGRIKVLQDCAATKPVYYAADSSFGTIVASHANLIAQSLELPADERAEKVYQSEIYRKDPSRYLPGMITPYKGLYALTANTALDIESGKPKRFFPRENLKPQAFTPELVEKVSSVMQAQAALLAGRKRPLMIAATAGRDSRVSMSALASYENARFFSFHISQSGHLSEDVQTAEVLTAKIGKDLEIYDLGKYHNADFRKSFTLTSPRGIWIAAAQCYADEFPEDAIHVRSTVSEIGRMFYGRRTTNKVSAEGLARTYTTTDFGLDPMVIETMQDFIDRAEFSEDRFFNYDIYDMFYWEHRNSKWQNILCMEAEMASDVFIPFNNRSLILLFLGLPEEHRKSAALHVAISKAMCPAIADVPYIS